MELDSLAKNSLDEAVRTMPDGPITMLNLLRFRSDVQYPKGFSPTFAEPQRAYYEGYAGALREVAKSVGVENIEVVLRGKVAAGLVVGCHDAWDDVVIVRYPNYHSFRRIVESEQYSGLADPHRGAAIRDWRLIAMKTA